MMGRSFRAAPASLLAHKLPTRGPVAGRALLDNPHRGEGAAIKAAADRRPLIVHHATPLPQVHAGPFGAPLEHQLAGDVPLGH
jgi:hypothetical protein